MNKKNFFIGLIGVLLLSSCGSKPYKVEREIEISVPAAFVFEKVGDYKTRGEWSPWDKIDPEMTKEYTGATSGLGAKYSWSSKNDDVGTGSMTCVESTASTYMKSDLAFTAPWESTSVIEWNFEESNNVTSINWSVSGELPGMAALFTDMEKILGSKLEEGLADLKVISEANYKEPIVIEVSDSLTTDSVMVDVTAEM